MALVANSIGCQELRTVSSRNAKVAVEELEFDRDATVPVWVPTILTQGSLPAASGMNLAFAECKHLMESVCNGQSSDEANWPDTDDGLG